MTALKTRLWPLFLTAGEPRSESLCSDRKVYLKADTMFRFTVIVCVSLVVCITAKPHKPRNKFMDRVFQDAVVSLDKDGKMSWGVEVEPPEDLEGVHFDIDPSMKIWKNMAGEGKAKHHLKAEEDLDQLNHPSMADLPRVQIRNTDVLPAAEEQRKFVRAEEDQDKVYHPEFNVHFEQDWDAVFPKEREELGEYEAEDRAGVRVRPRYTKAEEDMDHVDHKDHIYRK